MVQESPEELTLDLTPAQKRVLSLLHLKDYQIARQLKISPKTVQSYLHLIRERIGSKTRVDLALWATANGYLNNPYC